jgi:hypothetical protein
LGALKESNGNEERGKKSPLVYVKGGFSTAHPIQHGSISRNPHWGSALDAPEFIPGWLLNNKKGKNRKV